jgi:SpoVK/Ycf46/Vps4 family AAA+-type ATPase
MDDNDVFVVKQAAEYLVRVIERYPRIDKDSMEFACWILGADLPAFTDDLLQVLSPKQAQRFEQELEDCLDPEDYAREIYKSLKNDARKVKKVLRILTERLHGRKKILNRAKASDLEAHLKSLQSMFALTDQETEFCLFYFLTQNWDEVRQYFMSHLCIDEFSGRKYLQAALQLSPSALDSVLQGKLRRMGVVTNRRLNLEVEDDFLTLLMGPCNQNAPGKLYKEVQGSDVPLGSHLLDQEALQFLQGIFRSKKDLPTHVLIYGPAGTGKSSFARALAKSLPDQVFEILQDTDNESQKRRTAIQACLNMTNNGPGSIMIIDEADNLLQTRGHFLFRGEVQDKGWLNTFMEEPGVRAIWIVNDMDEIEDSVLRRFAYSLYFPRFSRNKRIQLWKRLINGNNLGRLIPKPAMHALAEDYEVSAGVMDMALKQAKSCHQPGKSSFVRRVRMALDAHIKLRNQGLMPKKQNTLDANFSLKGLNIQGDMNQAMNVLHSLNTGQKKTSLAAGGQYNLLFYGPPGTGKSEMAKYMARELDRDLIIKRASDLLDPYVGMTERRIASMFAQAEAQEALLLIDEADSFLYGRQMAHHSWEIGHVNEFLTQMENYQGILICTTNRFQGMDQASVRRFHHKLFFDYLQPEGIEHLYDLFLVPLCAIPMDKQSRSRLQRIKGLTPGDFKNIRDRHTFTNQDLTHHELITCLEEEVQAKKNEGVRGGIGF